MTITICGGGNLGHVCAGFLSSQTGIEVRVLTSRPEQWGQQLVVHDENRDFIGEFSLVTSSPAEALCGTDIVLLCLPGYALRPTLKSLRPHLEEHTIVGSVVSNTGFFFVAEEELPASVPLFGFQRVPFIARTEQYGHSATLLGHKPKLFVATLHVAQPDALRRTLEGLFQTPVSLLASHYEAALSNSNPLLHPSRLYTMWRDWTPGTVYERQCHFYAEWTDEAAALYIAMDRELQQLLRTLGVREGAVPDVLTYYESHDAASLAAKLRSIPAFQPILSPMKAVPGGYVPDFQSRYFTEDFPYGLQPIAELARRYNVPAPHMVEVLAWGKNVASN